jgi:hypothetical protein
MGTQVRWTKADVCCPGCGARLPADNDGCRACGWEDNGNDTGRISSIGEILDHDGPIHGDQWPCREFFLAVASVGQDVPTGIEAKVCALIAERQKVGVAKYGQEMEAENTKASLGGTP